MGRLYVKCFQKLVYIVMIGVVVPELWKLRLGIRREVLEVEIAGVAVGVPPCVISTSVSRAI